VNPTSRANKNWVRRGKRGAASHCTIIWHKEGMREDAKGSNKRGRLKEIYDQQGETLRGTGEIKEWSSCRVTTSASQREKAQYFDRNKRRKQEQRTGQEGEVSGKGAESSPNDLEPTKIKPEVEIIKKGLPAESWRIKESAKS